MSDLAKLSASNQMASLLSQVSDSVTCVICQELMCMPCVFECGHSYCYECASTWFTKSSVCPTCRKECKKRPHISHAIMSITNSIIAALVQADPSRKAEYDELKRKQKEEYDRDIAIHNTIFPGLFSDDEDAENNEFGFDASLASTIDFDISDSALDAGTSTDSESDAEEIAGQVFWYDRLGRKYYLNWGEDINELIMRTIGQFALDVPVVVTDGNAEIADDPASLLELGNTEAYIAVTCLMVECLDRRGRFVHQLPSERVDIDLNRPVRNVIIELGEQKERLIIRYEEGEENVFTRDRVTVVDTGISIGSDSEGYYSS